MQFMRNLKNILQSKWFFLLFFLFTLGFVFFSYFHKNDSFYQKNETSLEGRILEYKIDGNLLSMVVRGKEKVEVYYWISTEKEKEDVIAKIGYGKKVQLTGTFELPEDTRIFHTFSYKDYLLSHRIHYLFKGETIHFSYSEPFLYTLKNKFRQYLETFSHSEYYLAFFLGEKSGLDIETLQKNGVSHLFAISGMHLTFFLFFCEAILKKNKISSTIITILFCLYGFMVSFPPSFLRAFLFYFGKKGNQKYKIWNSFSLFLVIFLLLLWINPFYLLDIGFQYSILLSGFFLLLPVENHFFRSLWHSSCLSFLVSIPITASHFYEVNVLSIFFNLLWIPCFSILYPCCFLAIFFPYVSIILNPLLSLVDFLNQIFATCTFGKIVIPNTMLWVWVGYYIVLLLFFLVKKKRYFFYLLFLLFSIKIAPFWKTSAQVFFLDVGQGDATIFVSPHLKETILIDTGGTVSLPKKDWEERKPNYNTARNMITFFHSLGISKINTLVLTHGDTDHLGNASFLLKEFPISKIVLNQNEDTLFEQEIKKQYLQKITKKLESKIFSIQELTQNSKKENDASLIYRIQIFQTSFLMMGDASIDTENKLTSYPLKSDILKVGHHGSSTSSSASFLKKVHPSLAIISVGKNNIYHHPSEETLTRLQKEHIFPLLTSEVGTIHIKVTKKGYFIHSYFAFA